MDTILRPVITEKSLILASKGWYTFAVDPVAGKALIARDISELYNVKVVDIRTSIVPGKSRRVGRRGKTVETAPWKKATVKLASGQKIDAFEIGGAAEGQKK